MPKLYLLVSLLFLVYLCQAQPFMADQAVVHYTDENGLPQNSIKSIAADKNGFLWLATESGLTRFDGHDFFTFDKNNADLKSSRFYCLLPDLTSSPDRLYAIGDNLDDVLRIEKQHAVKDLSYYSEQFKRIPYSNTESDRIASGLPNQLLSVKDDALRYYIIFVPNRTGCFYIIHRNKIEYFQNWNKQWERLSPGNDFNRYVCLKGRLFYFDDNGNFSGLDQHRTEKINMSGEILHDQNYNPASPRNVIYWNHLSDQLFIQVGQRFYHLDYVNKHTLEAEQILDNFDFEKNTIQTAFYDKVVKRLLLGSATHGLYVFKHKPFTTLLSGDNVLDNIFYAQTAYGENRILTPKGLILGKSQGGKNKNGVLNASSPVVRAGFNIDGNSILRDNNGYIWSKSGYILYQYDPEGKKLLNSWNMGNQIYTLYKGSDGRIWLGMNLKGLYYIDPSGNMSAPVPVKGNFVKDIYYIAESQQNLLWLVTHKGVFSVDTKTGKATVLAGTEPLNIRGLFMLPVQGKTQGEASVLITTTGDGMYVFHKKKLIKLPLDAKRYLNAAHYIVEDRKGFLWIPTNKGLFQFAKADIVRWVQKAAEGVRGQENPFFLYYSKEDGFNTNEFNGGCQPCAVRLPNGQLSLASMNGLVWFDPDQIPLELPKEDLVLDRVEVQDKTTLILGDTLHLAQNPRQLNFFVTVPYFGNAYNVNLSYAITPSGTEPVDADWISLKSDDPIIRFSQLASGHYTLWVRKKNGFGENNYHIKSITVLVAEQWFETFWFRLLCVLFFCMIIYFFIRFRTRYLIKKNNELEVRIAARTQKLAEALSQLQVSEKQLSRQMHMWTKLVASISHDIRTPMTFLASAAERIEPMISRQQLTEASLVGTTIASSAKQIRQLLENMINYIKTQYKGERIQYTEFALEPLVTEKIRLFGPAIAAQRNQFINVVDSSTTVFSNMHLLAIVIHNLMDNANKFTSGGQVSIYTQVRDGRTSLNIHDTGMGLPPRVVTWLNTSPTEYSNEAELKVTQEFNGLGLLMVKEITTMLGIRILVTVNEGTHFCLMFNMD